MTNTQVNMRPWSDEPGPDGKDNVQAIPHSAHKVGAVFAYHIAVFISTMFTIGILIFGYGLFAPLDQYLMGVLILGIIIYFGALPSVLVYHFTIESHLHMKSSLIIAPTIGMISGIISWTILGFSFDGINSNISFDKQFWENYLEALPLIAPPGFIGGLTYAIIRE